MKKLLNPISKQTRSALDFLCERNVLSEYWDTATYVSKLTDFIANKGEDALQALAGFYVWVIENVESEKQAHALSSTFSHDLGGQEDEWMLPRSTNYLKYWQNSVVDEIRVIQNILKRKRDDGAACTKEELAKVKKFIRDCEVVGEDGQIIEWRVELFSALKKYFPNEHKKAMAELEGKTH